MMPKFLLSAAMAVLVAFGPALAEGKVPLPQEAHINAQLIAAAAGDMLRKTCPTLRARTFVVLTKLAQLESYARGQGYTEAEVNVFLKDRAEKTRIKTAARDYLTEAGVVEGDAASFCRVGQSEIAAESLVGSLLRVTN